MAKKTPHDEQPTGDFMEVGKEVVPGMRLRCVCRGHTGPIGRIAWSPCGRFIASPSKTRPSASGTPRTENAFRYLKGTKTPCIASRGRRIEQLSGREQRSDY